MVSPVADNHHLVLPDGRHLAYAEYGDPAGRPLLYHHGMPGSRLELAGLARRTFEGGVHCIAPDRPGYGRSDPQENRTLTQWADDVARLVDQLGWRRFSVAGFSGGGPFALAAAHAMGKRIDRVVLLASLAPFRFPEGPAAMADAVRDLYFAARDDAPALTEQLHSAIPDGEALYQTMTHDLPAADRDIFNDAAAAEQYRENLSEAMRGGLTEVVREMGLIASDWSFKPVEIIVPVRLWHGRDDRKAPFAMARQLAEHLPDAKLIPLVDQGHFFPFTFWSSILQDLLRTG